MSLTQKQYFLRLVLRNLVKMTDAISRGAEWSTTGAAAFAAILISNADNLKETVSKSGLRVGLILLGASILFGAMARLIGIAIAASRAAVSELEEFLKNCDDPQLKTPFREPLERMFEEMSGAFLWPFSTIVRKCALKGARDPIYSDRMNAKLFCIQLFTHLLHWLFAIGAVVVIAFAI